MAPVLPANSIAQLVNVLLAFSELRIGDSRAESRFLSNRHQLLPVTSGRRGRPTAVDSSPDQSSGNDHSVRVPRTGIFWSWINTSPFYWLLKIL